MGFKPRSEFWKNVKRLADKHREACKTNPVLKAEWEKCVRQGECRATHKKWREDWDVHGALGRYCKRCGVAECCYDYLQYQRRSFMTCDEILAEK